MNKRGFLALSAAALAAATTPARAEAQPVTQGPSPMTAIRSGYAPINGMQMYFEVHGSGKPLILLHGGLGLGAMFGPVLGLLAAGRQVILPDLQAHGRTADIDRPMTYPALGDDVAQLIRHLDLGKVDVMGYSMGGGAALQAAFQAPELIDRLVVVSAPFTHAGWYPEILAGQRSVNAAAAPYMTGTPMEQSYMAVAPKPEEFPRLLDRTGGMMQIDYDWSSEVRALEMPLLLAFGDSDAVPPGHAARFYELLGGGLKDADWDGKNMVQSRLAILPGLTHYTVFMAPALAEVAIAFLDGGGKAQDWSAAK